MKSVLALIVGTLCMCVYAYAHSEESPAKGCIASFYNSVRQQGFVTPEDYEGIGMYYAFMPVADADAALSKFITESHGTNLSAYRVLNSDLLPTLRLWTRFDYYAESGPSEGNRYVVAVYSAPICTITKNSVIQVLFAVYNYQTWSGKVYVPLNDSNVSNPNVLKRGGVLLVPAKRTSS